MRRIHWPRVRGQNVEGSRGPWQWVLCDIHLWGPQGWLCMHCQQGLGTEGRPRNEEQEQYFDKAAVTEITTRMSSDMQTDLWKNVGKACRTQKSEHSDSYLHGVLTAATADSGSRGETCKVLSSQTDEGPKKLAQHLKMQVDPTVIITSA